MIILNKLGNFFLISRNFSHFSPLSLSFQFWDWQLLEKFFKIGFWRAWAGSRESIQIFWRKWVFLGLYKDLYCTSFLTLKISIQMSCRHCHIPCGKGENILEKWYLLEKHPNVPAWTHDSCWSILQYCRLCSQRHTVIRFLWISAKFGTCTVVSVNLTIVEDKMRKFKGECAQLSFNKWPIYTHDGASAKFSTKSQEMDNSAEHNQRC